MTSPSTPEATAQDGEGLVTEKILDDLLVAYFGSWDWVEELHADETGSAYRERFRAALAAVAPDIAAAAYAKGLRDGLSAALAAAEGNPDADRLLAEVLRELRAVAESSEAVAVLAEALYGDRDRSGDHTVVTIAREAAPLIRVGRQVRDLVTGSGTDGRG